jgi:hypothetical protein
LLVKSRDLFSGVGVGTSALMAHTRDRGASPPSGRRPEQDRKYLKKNDNFPAPMISALERIANQTLPLTLPRYPVEAKAYRRWATVGDFRGPQRCIPFREMS